MFMLSKDKLNMNEWANSAKPTFGNKLICKRPTVLAMSVQVINVAKGNEMAKLELNIDFGDMPKNIPDFTNKKTVRLNKGEVALLIGFALGYISKVGVGHRESGLWLSFNLKDGQHFINLFKNKDKLHYLELQMAERYQIFQLCLECLMNNDKSSADVLNEVKTFFLNSPI